MNNVHLDFFIFIYFQNPTIKTLIKKKKLYWEIMSVQLLNV